MNYYIFFCFLSSILVVHTADPYPYQSIPSPTVSPTIPNFIRASCAPSDIQNKVTRYSNTFICINIDNKRTVINPTADTFSSIIIPESFHYYFANLQGIPKVTSTPLSSPSPRASTPINSWMIPSASPTPSSMNRLSVSPVTHDSIMIDICSYDIHSLTILDGMKYYYNYLPSTGMNKESGYYVFPTYTVILHVIQGKVERITFDEECLCSEQSTSESICLENSNRIIKSYINNTNNINNSTNSISSAIPKSCAIPITSCVYQPTKDYAYANTCDLQLFFVWSGTDSEQQFFTSSAKRFSRFRAWPAQLTQLWENIKDTGNRIIDSLNPLNRN